MTEIEKQMSNRSLGLVNPYLDFYERWKRGEIESELGRFLRTNAEPIVQELHAHKPAYMVGVEDVQRTVEALERERNPPLSPHAKTLVPADPVEIEKQLVPANQINHHTPRIPRSVDDMMGSVMRVRESVDGWMMRDQGICEFGYSVPTEDAIVEIAHINSRIVSVGAGAGYWEGLLAQVGCDVVAYDIRADAGAFDMYEGKDRIRFPIGQYHPVRQGDAPKVVADHADRTLLMCWPEMAKWPLETLLMFHAAGGRNVVFVGDPSCTADDKYHKYLREKFQSLPAPPIPSWPMINDVVRLHQALTAEERSAIRETERRRREEAMAAYGFVPSKTADGGQTA